MPLKTQSTLRTSPVSGSLSSFGGGLLGDGSDGAATLDGTATVAWASKAGSVYTLTRDTCLTALTINSGVTLRPAGFRLLASMSITNNGTISVDGPNASGATAGAGSGASINGSSAGGAGTTGVGTAAAAATFAFGGAGGAGGTGISGAGGAGGNATAPPAFTGGPQVVRTLPGATVGFGVSGGAVTQVRAGSGGGGGAGDGTNSGGGGGASGGIALIATKTFDNTSGTVSARGGNGAAGVAGNSGGGGGGGGGLILISCVTNVGSGTLSVAGGTAGAGAGTGATGTAGNAGQAITNVFG